jgi:hypothetical protein
VLEENPALLTGDAHLSPLRAIPRFAEILDEAGVAGVVRPSCGHCGRTVRIYKPLDGVRACRRCHARSRAQPCGRCGAVRDPVTRDSQGRPVVPPEVTAKTAQKHDYPPPRTAAPAPAAPAPNAASPLSRTPPPATSPAAGAA